MPLMFAKSPRGAEGAFAELPELGGQQFAGPISVYALSRARLRSRDPLQGLRLAAWKFLVVTDERIQTTLEVERAGKAFRLRNVAPSEAAGWQRALVASEALLEVTERTYTPRAIVSPTIGLTALWLRGRGRTADLFTLVGPAYWPFEPEQWYDSARFLSRVRHLARRQDRRRAEPASRPNGGALPV